MKTPKPMTPKPAAPVAPAAAPKPAAPAPKPKVNPISRLGAYAHPSKKK